jgi:hypothetical protein
MKRSKLGVKLCIFSNRSKLGIWFSFVILSLIKILKQNIQNLTPSLYQQMYKIHLHDLHPSDDILHFAH